MCSRGQERVGFVFGRCVGTVLVMLWKSVDDISAKMVRQYSKFAMPGMGLKDPICFSTVLCCHALQYLKLISCTSFDPQPKLNPTDKCITTGRRKYAEDTVQAVKANTCKGRAGKQRKGNKRWRGSQGTGVTAFGANNPRRFRAPG